MSTPLYAFGAAQVSALQQAAGPQADPVSAAGSALPNLPLRRLGLSMRFQVVVGSGGGAMSLGHWTSCEGLKVEFKCDPFFEGGDYATPHLLLKNVEYAQVTLKRAVEQPYSATVQDWLGMVAAAWQAGDTSLIGQPVVISLLDAFQLPANPAAEWVLTDAFPVSWAGPSMTAKSTDVATETLVLRHSGFLGNTPSASTGGAGAMGSP
jgi:phage tail-like protein